MTADASLPAVSARQRSANALGLSGAIAWRNLWRNRRRTLISAGAIAFAVALLSFAMSMQAGTYGAMVDNATRLLAGHLQLQRRGYLDDPRIENAIEGVSGQLVKIRAVRDVVAATPRIAAFVLVAGDDRSYGAQLLGVDPVGERLVSTLPNMVTEGRYVDRGPEAYAGKALARNLGVSVGDQIVVLGTASNGGVAALAVKLVGTFSSGVAVLDRQLIEVPIASVAEAFEMHDAAHAIVVRAASVDRARSAAADLRADVPANEVVLEWPVLLPDLQQAIFLDRAFGNVMFGVLAAVVTIGVLNGFLMTVFERTREFGMLLAVGMRARAVVGLLQAEAALLSCIGCAAGIAIGVPLVVWLGRVGIPVGETGAALRAFHIADRLHPALSVTAFVRPVVLMVVCTQFAALLPALRVRRILPVEALRAT